jgi:polar amino acid transport system permease protein
MAYEWRFDVVLDNLPTLLDGLTMTCVLTVLAMTIGIVVGLLLALMRLSPWRIVGLPAQVFTELFRTTPLLVQVVWVYTVLPLTLGVTLSPFFSGLMALGLNVAAFMAEIFRSGITSVDRGQHQAALALGMTRAQANRRIIFPQAILRMVPPIAAMWVALFKDTSILATIGVVELMYEARYLASDTFRPLEIFTAAAAIYFLLTYPQSLLVNRLFERFRVRE